MQRTRPSRSQASIWPWAAAGALAGTLAALLVFAPARWAAAAVERATQGRVVLAQPRGTVWNGSAQFVLTGGPGSADTRRLPGELEWRLRPRLDGVRLKLHPGCCADAPLPMRLRWRPGRVSVTVDDGALRLPAALLAGLGTPWNTLQLEGGLTLYSQSLSVEWSEGRLAVAGQAELVANDLTSRLSTVRPMGSYRISLTGGTPAAVRLETLQGPLQLSGHGTWVDRRLRFSGEATSAEEHEAALANLLNIIGRRSGRLSIMTLG